MLVQLEANSNYTVERMKVQDQNIEKILRMTKRLSSYEIDTPIDFDLPEDAFPMTEA